MHLFTRRRLVAGAALAAGAGLPALRPRAAVAAGPLDLDFMLHADFFSAETHQPRPLDPQAFVADPQAKAGVGPQGIHHVDGVRPAFVAGPRDVAVLNAQGKALGFTLGEWFAAKGKAQIRPEGAGARIACKFSALLPNARYSLFENHFDQKPIGFSPLDGAGTANNFTTDANGTASVTLHAPRPLTHANGVLLVYHSDNQFHGTKRGQIGVTAHHQIIVRLPA